jgi:hypothetical protein
MSLRAILFRPLYGYLFDLIMVFNVSSSHRAIFWFTTWFFYWILYVFWCLFEPLRLFLVHYMVLFLDLIRILISLRSIAPFFGPLYRSFIGSYTYFDVSASHRAIFWSTIMVLLLDLIRILMSLRAIAQILPLVLYFLDIFP